MFELDQPPTDFDIKNRKTAPPRFLRRDDYIYFADPDLGGYPILPTCERLRADERFTGRGITIAFVDSGFYPHPDLLEPVNRVLAVYDAIDDSLADIEEFEADRKTPIEAWHGTMTSCAAIGNGRRSNGMYRGIASGANAVLVKTMTPKFNIRTPEVVRGLTWVKKNIDRYNIRVVSMSIGVDEVADSVDHPVIKLIGELHQLGVIVVAASGNSPERSVRPPGAARLAVTVGGMNDDNTIDAKRWSMFFSSYGSSPDGYPKPDLVAPSVLVAAPILPYTKVKEEADALFVLATGRGASLMRNAALLAKNTSVPELFLDAKTPARVREIALHRIKYEKLISTEYKHVDGTSFAAAIVSSVAAQLLEAQPRLDPDELKFILCATAVPLSNVPAEQQGNGVIRADRALDYVQRM